ncbi:MAG: beta-eliminating lyase-related protein [Myxococcota bacterium]
MDAASRAALKRQCRLFKGHPPRSPAEVLAEAAAWCEAQGVRADVYGTGELVTAFEADIAARVGFPAARLMPSGTMAQQIALRVWAERAGHAHVGSHATSHVELHEERGYAHLHGLRLTLVGPAHRPVLAADLEAVKEPLSALLVELPIREAGGQLPSWEELEALKAAASARGIPLHLDGARLWGCGPHFGRSLPEITAGFASAYVSLYKEVGAISGAVLLGDPEFLAEAAVWQRRHGGTLVSQYPAVATAAMQLDAQLARMPRWREHALAIAGALRGLDGVRMLPDPPHTSMFHLMVAVAPEQAAEARDRVAEAHGIWLFDGARPCDVPGWSRFEVAVHEAAMALTPDAVRAALAELVA